MQGPVARLGKTNHLLSEKLTNCSDVLVMGAGPAALCIVAELVQQGLKVTALASHAPDKPWPNTYGIWAEEV